MRQVIASLVMLVACGHHGPAVSELAKEDATVIGLAADDAGVAWLAKGADESVLKVVGTSGNPVVVAHGTIFSVGLDAEHVYWSDGEHLWRSPRGKPSADQIVDATDIVRDIQIDGGYVYWALPTKVARLPVAGGASEDVATAPEIGQLQRVAVNGGHIVATIPLEKTTEIWQLDGEPHRLAALPGITDALFLDGTTIAWARLNGETRQTLLIGLDGHEGNVVQGTAVEARRGAVYVSRHDGTFRVSDDGKTETKLGPRSFAAVVTPTRLVGAFEHSIGSISLAH